MPLLEFKCPEHGEFELLISSSRLQEDSKLLDRAQCPECGHQAPRQYAGSGGTVIYKGNWFKNKGSY